VLNDLQFQADDKAKIICDPYFNATGEDGILHINRCYDVTPEFAPGSGIWTIRLSLNLSNDPILFLRTERTGDIQGTQPSEMVTRRNVSTTCVGPSPELSTVPICTKRYPLYYDAVKGCVLIGKPGKTLEEADLAV
jgi:hypothetical protein